MSGQETRTYTVAKGADRLVRAELATYAARVVEERTRFWRPAVFHVTAQPVILDRIDAAVAKLSLEWEDRLAW